jgi:hypothetical protein
VLELTPRDQIEKILKEGHADRRLLAANEATLRMAVINRVIDALGWPFLDSGPESPTGAGDYLDYELKTQLGPWMVVEAKRAGDAFEIPDSLLPARSTTTRSLQPLLRRGGRLMREALQQAATYCNDKGIALACVTNGFQWIFYRGLSGPNRPWTAGCAVTFNGLDDVIARFDLFLGCLSRSHAATPFLLRLLDRPGDDALPAITNPKDHLSVRPGPADRANTAVLRSVNDFLFSEITGVDRAEMLAECYVKPGFEAEFDRTLQRLLKDTARHLDDGNQMALEGGPDEFVREVSAQEKSNIRNPVVLVGHVGVGKTTFLNRVIKQFRDDSTAVCALVDLEGYGYVGDAAADERRIAEAILEKLGHSAKAVLRHVATSEKEQLQADPMSLEALRTMFRDSLKSERALGEAVWASDPQAWPKREYDFLLAKRDDVISMLPHYIRHLRARFKKDDGSKYPVIVALDNLDLSSDDYQKFVYRFAQRLARDTPAVIILSMREDTFESGQRPGGFLTSSPLQFVFHVRAPSLDRLLRKRVEFGEHARDRGLLPTPIMQEDDAITAACRLVRSALLMPQSEALEIIIGLAGHNVRDALALVRGVVQGSAATHARADASASFAFECLVAALGADGFRARWGLGNCFDTEPASPPLHALRARLLGYFDWAFGIRDRTFAEQTDAVISRFGSWGYPVAAVTAALQAILDAGLLRPLRGEQMAPGDLPRRLSITAAGHVHLTKLFRLGAYRAAMAMVMRWYDADSAQRFIQKARDAGGVDGPTVGDVSVSDAPLVFDGYLAEMIAKERGTLSPEVGRSGWATETLSRSAGLLPTVLSAAREDRTPSPPKAKNQPSAKQLTLVSERQSVLPTISRDLAHDGTVWIPRILWALEMARRNSWGALTAADISRILKNHGNIDVPNTNVARAFRDQGHSELWCALGKRYQITDAGTLVIRGLVGDSGTVGDLKRTP